ncbi:ATPase PAAT [Tenrec ecaudatus]|uniref:ATPase PAAT n=1 Tax=Tenrec ecaudatus TaxID=94439 RepID=UPI003F596315
MEAGTEGPGLTCRPTLASSWAAPCGTLAQSLLLSRGALGAGEFDWEQLLAPPAPGEDLVTLKRSLNNPEENPCFLYLACDPDGGEEIVSVGVLSSARNMEVYLGEEYCGTSRGRRACTILEPSDPEKIILYKKYLQLEPPALACKVKLLSFGEKHCVSLRKVVVRTRPAPASTSTGGPTLGARINLDRVQTIVEAVGSKLSPGAQQLMALVRFQQQNCIPFGEPLQSVLGHPGCRQVFGLQSAEGLNNSSSTPFPLRTGLASARGAEDAQARPAQKSQPNSAGSPREPGKSDSVPQSHTLREEELQSLVASFFPKRASSRSDVPSSGVLPLLQDVCAQVNHLRAGHRPDGQEKLCVAGANMEEQPACSYLEKILSKHMEVMEKNLMGYIDERLDQLQEHLERKLALLMDSPPAASPRATRMPLRQGDSGEKLSNGER